MHVTSSEGMKIKHCLAILPSEKEGVKFSIYLDYWWRRRHHGHYRSSRRRGSSGGRGSDRRDISSDGWHRGGSNDGRLRHGWRDVLERGRRGDGRHGHCLLRSFQTTKWKHTAMYWWLQVPTRHWEQSDTSGAGLCNHGLGKKLPVQGHRKSTKDKLWFAWCCYPRANKKWEITDLSPRTVNFRPATCKQNTSSFEHGVCCSGTVFTPLVL